MLNESEPGSKGMCGVEASEQELHKSAGELPSLEGALNCLDQLPQLPSVEKFICILQKCRKEKNLADAKRLHAYICNCGLEPHKYLGNHLVPLFVECGSMSDALQVCNRLVDSNEYSWTSLIMGYVECGESQQALNLYQEMQADCVHPSQYTFVALVKACARLKDVDRGQEIHAEVARKGLDANPFVSNTLVDMYAKCGFLTKAEEVFGKLPVRDIVSWNALIAGYSERGLRDEVLNCFQHMQFEGVSPDAVTFVCSLKACGCTGAIDKGQEIHAKIAAKGLERDPSVGNTMVYMYAKCGSLAKAQEVLDKLPVRDIISWNALIAGYAEHGLGEETLKCFQQMQLEGVPPDAATFVSSLKACGSIGAIDKGREIHTEIARKGLERNHFVGSTLVNMYAKCGSLAKARVVFDKLLVRDVVSWTALVAGYAEHRLGEEALNCLEHMQTEGICPDAVTFVCSLKACSSTRAIDKGREIHGDIVRKGLERDPFVGSTLIDMYAKGGSLARAREVFDKLPVRDVVSWSALVAAYADHGLGEEALDCFEQMKSDGLSPGVVSWSALIAGYAQLGESEIVFHMVDKMRGEGIKPNGVIFLNVLTVCCHAGLVNKGQKYFEAMNKDYGITPTIEHHICMVDLLCRAGNLDEGLAMVEKMPFQPVLAVWHIVMCACQKWGNVELGRRAFEHAVQLDEKDAAVYVLMSNIHAVAHMREDKTKVKVRA